MTKELARRAVACEGWRWMPGMLATKYVGVGMTTRFVVTSAYGDWLYHSGDDRSKTTLCLPDLNDPATLGCLLALVREAWQKPGLHARRRGSWLWAVYGDSWNKRGPIAIRETEAEALVAALEEAPSRAGGEE